MMKFAMLIGAGLLAAPAFAGSLDQPVTEPAIEAVPQIAPVNTGGDWTGAYAGVQLGFGKVTSTGTALEGQGALGGVHAGYNHDFGKLVLGGEVDWDKAKADLSSGAGTLESIARLKLKAGADLGRVMVYGTAGVAQANATVGGASLSDTGVFGGLGLDYALSDKWVVGGEVLRHNFGNFDSSGIDLNATTVTARASLKF